MFPTQRHLLTIALLLALPSIRCVAQILYGAKSAGLDHYKTVSVMLQDGRVLIIGGETATSSGSTTCELYDPRTNRYTPTGPMTTPRAWHSAVLLNNGKVLVLGGYTGQTLASCELYDPITGTWSPTGSLNTSRSRTSATLLADGHVLAASGFSSNGGITTSCEIYDPATGSWTPTASMQSERSSHAGVLLSSGKVLIVSGYPYHWTCELYDPATKQWRLTGSILGFPTGEHSLTRLSDGRVLLAGGWGGTRGMTSRCQIYDPQTETWRLTSSLAMPRCAHRTVLLPDGRVFLIAGITTQSPGQDNTCYSIPTTEIFDPVSERWSAGPTLPIETTYFAAALLPSGAVWLGAGGKRDVNQDPAFFHRESFIVDFTSGSFAATGANRNGHDAPTATLLPDGRVLLAGGNTDCANTPGTAIERYDYRSGTWNAIPASSIPANGHSATLMADGSVLIAGGQINGIPTAGTAIFQAALDRWTPGPPIGTPRHGHTATLLMNGTVMVTGGTTSSGITASVEIFDPATQTWSGAAPLPTALEGHTATLLTDGRVLVAGGNSATSTVKDCFIYDPICDIWNPTDRLRTPRAYHTATLLADGTVLIAGGETATGACELYDPATSTFTPAGALGTPRRHHTATLLSNGNVVVIGGDGGSGTSLADAETYSPVGKSWRVTGTMPEGRTRHAAVLLPTDKLLIAGGSSIGGAGCTTPSTSYLFDPQHGYREADRPTITSVAPASLSLSGSGDAVITVTGSGFRDDNNRNGSEGSTGDYNNTPTNYPIVEIRRIGGDRYGSDFTGYLPFDVGNASWSSTRTQVRLPLGTPEQRIFPAGWYALRVIANGIPSVASFLQITYTDAPSLPTFTISPITIDCDGSASFDISSSCLIRSMQIDGETMSNVTMRIDSSIPSSGQHVTLKLIDPSREGRYALKINGGRIVQGVVPSSTRFDVVGMAAGSAPISIAAGCDSIIIHNRSSSLPLVLNDIHLRWNVGLSLPPSQLPLVIPPGGNRSLAICRTPSATTTAYDTLIIDGECSPVAIPLASVGSTLALYGQGEDCQAIIRSRPATIRKGIIVAGSPMVDRDGSTVWLRIDRYARDGADLPGIDGSLYDLFGRPIRDGEFLGATRTSDGIYAIEHGTMRIDVHDCPSGYYVVAIETPDGMTGYPITIVR